jgi:hypothetical protein
MHGTRLGLASFRGSPAWKALNEAVNEADFGVEGQFLLDEEHPELALCGGRLRGVPGRVGGRSEGGDALPEEGHRLVRMEQANEGQGDDEVRVLLVGWVRNERP